MYVHDIKIKGKCHEVLFQGFNNVPNMQIRVPRNFERKERNKGKLS